MMRRCLPAWSFACALALSLAASAADPVKFDVKPGLWETTSTGKASGMPAIPPEMLQQLPPEQREKIMAGIGAAMTKPITAKSCLTSEKLSEAFTKDVGEGCDRKVVANSSTEFTVTGSCTNHQGKQHFEAHFQRRGPDEVVGAIKIVATGEQNMTIERDIKSRWLGASCGNVK